MIRLVKELPGVFRSRLGLKLSLPVLIAVGALTLPVFLYFHYENSTDLSSLAAIESSQRATQAVARMDAGIRQEMLDIHEVLLDSYKGIPPEQRFIADFNAADTQVGNEIHKASLSSPSSAEQKQLNNLGALNNDFGDIFHKQLLPLASQPGTNSDSPESQVERESTYDRMTALTADLATSFRARRDATIQAQTQHRESIENIGWLGAIAGVFLGLLAAGLLTRRLLVPVRNVMDGAERISQGDLKHRIPEGKGRDEIAKMAVAFNTMASSLDRQVEQLQTEKARIRSVHQSIGDGILVVDRGGVISSLNPAAEAIMGHTSAQMEGTTNTGIPELQKMLAEPVLDQSRMVECWQEKDCDRTECPAHGSIDRRCWLQCGTFCRNQIQGTFKQKRDACERCDVFQANAARDGEFKIDGRCFGVSIAPVLDDLGREMGRTVVLHDVTEIRRSQSEAEHHTAELAVLNQISDILSSTLQTKRVLGGVLKKLLAASGAEAAAIHLLTDSGDRLMPVAWLNLPENVLKALQTQPKGQGISWRVVQTGEAMRIDDMSKRTNMVPAVVSAGLRSAAAVPLMSKDEVIGCLVLATSRLKPFSEDEVRVLKLAGGQIGAAMANSSLYEDSLKHAEKERARSRIAASLATGLELGQVFESFARETQKLVDFDRISIVLNAGDGMLRTASQMGEGLDEWRPGNAFPAADTMPGWVIEHRRPYLSKDIAGEDRFAAQQTLARKGYHSQAGVPIVLRGEVLGCLNLSSRRTGVYSETDIKELKPVANQVALALENQRLFENVSRARDEWEATFDSVAEGIIVIDSGHDIRHINKAAARMVGGHIEELLGKKCHEVISEICFEPEKCPLVKAVQSDQPSRGEQETADGRTLELTVDPMRDGQNNQVGAVLFLRDITEAKRLREQLVQSEKMVAVGQLVSGVAHEINNPLTGVVGYSQLLLSQDIDDKAKRDAQAIYDEAQRATRIVRHLLSFARKHAPEQRMVDINAVIKESAELMAYDLRVNNISVETRLDEKLPATMADPHQLQQVFLNLIANAEQAMLASRGSGRIKISTRKVGGRIRAVFADDGPGVPEELHDRIFDPFFTTKDVGQGTGLGLSICYGILKEHHGRIWVESGGGPGAVMVVELPVVAAPAGTAEQQSAGAARKRLGKILLVDDEASIREALREMLSRSGHQVDTAEDGQVALKLMEQQHYDCVVSDVKMPVMDGPALFEAARRLDPALAESFIFISGDSVNPRTRKFLGRMGNPWLVKPFSPEDLEQELQKLLTPAGDSGPQ